MSLQSWGVNSGLVYFGQPGMSIAILLHECQSFSDDQLLHTPLWSRSPLQRVCKDLGRQLG